MRLAVGLVSVLDGHFILNQDLAFFESIHCCKVIKMVILSQIWVAISTSQSTAANLSMCRPCVQDTGRTRRAGALHQVRQQAHRVGRLRRQDQGVGPSRRPRPAVPGRNTLSPNANRTLGQVRARFLQLIRFYRNPLLWILCSRSLLL